MATVEELVRQYQTDPELQKEVADILEDEKISFQEFAAFAINHNAGLHYGPTQIQFHGQRILIYQIMNLLLWPGIYILRKTGIEV